MTVDLVRTDHNALAVLGNANDALARLGQWVEAARNAHQLVDPLVDTAFVPEAYKPKVDPRATPDQKAQARAVAVANATAAVLQGITLGLDPLTALQQIYIVHGRPGMYARLMVALVQAHGHEVWVEDISDTRCVVAGRRKGGEHIERVVVTMDQARKAGWTSNQNYAKTPQDMLYARAAGRVCNHIASDVLMGIASVEEIQDSIQATAEVGNGRRTVTPRRSRLKPVHEAFEDPPLDDETPAPAPSTSAPAPPAGHATGLDPVASPDVAAQGQAIASITPAQQRKMHALFREHDMADREAGLMYVTTIVGRPVQSTKELTVEEAGAVIDALEETAPTAAEPELDLEAE